MRSFSTAKKSPAKDAGRSAILRAIKKFITPLSPPVFAFEASIRSTPFRILISVLLSARTQDPVTEKAAGQALRRGRHPGKNGAAVRGADRAA